MRVVLFNEYRKMTKIFTYYKNSLQTRKSINFHKLVTNIYKKRERTLYLMTKDYFHLMAKLAFPPMIRNKARICSHHILLTQKVLAFAIRQG